MSFGQISLQRRRDEKHVPAGRLAITRTNWHEIAERFTGERECLASYLALEAAEVIGGVKPANLINLIDRQRPCGRNLYQLWKQHGMRLLAQSGLAARVLVQRDDSTLILIYHPARLAAHLATKKVANFLCKAGYCQPTAMAQVLEDLASRFAIGGFPHEIGAILGYPLKDVAGFMGWVNLPITHQGPWKMYGDSQSSLAMVAACRQCRDQMVRHLCMGVSPFACLEQNSNHSFFFTNK